MGLSPMMQHYIEVKEKHKDCIVFYRLGDFYEMFFEDAIKASAILDLTLTGRDCGLENRAPMCGIPFHAKDEYIAKLVANGEKVAICEQLTPPSDNPKELVVRDVVRIVTAGTVTNTDLINDKENNFLASIYIEAECASLSWADITTGEFFCKEFTSTNYLNLLFSELVKIAPVEIIGNEKAQKLLNNSPLILHNVLPKVQSIAESEFALSSAISVLSSQLNTNNLSVIFNNCNTCICSSGALVSYLHQTQKGLLSNIKNIKVLNNSDCMMLDFNTVRNLELIKSQRDNKKYGTLYWVLDKTVTSMGARKLQSYILSPLNQIQKIEYRLNAVEMFFNDNYLRNNVIDLLKQVKDVNRLAGKISNGNLSPKDCIALARSLEVLPTLKFQLSGCNVQLITDVLSNFIDYSKLINLINVAIYDDLDEQHAVNKKNSNQKLIKPGYNSQLDELRELFTNGKNLISKLEEKEREKTGIKTLRISYNRIFGYFIEVTNSFKDKVPYDYIRRQTLVNCERYVTEELKNLESQIITAEEKFYQLENSLYAQIKQELLEYIIDLQNTADAIAELDVIASLATISKENNYSRPIICDINTALEIKDGRHPVVEKANKIKFIPNDCLLDNNDNLINVITGPNMAGKSTYMRQVALIIILAHIGCFVPAKSASIPLTDRVFTRIGASDNLILNQSTFMVEMGEMATILSQATDNSFLILDEIGRGTSTFDGLSIAWSIIEYIAKTLKSKTLFATHYHELTELEGKLHGVKNYKITVKEFDGSIIFLRKIARGGANKSFGIEVAKLAGIGDEITDRAKQILKELENKDITKNKALVESFEKQEKSDVERIISDIDVNSLSPLQAFSILCDLSEKLKD